MALCANSVHACKYGQARALMSVFTQLKLYFNICALFFLISLVEESSQPIANQLNMKIKLSYQFFDYDDTILDTHGSISNLEVLKLCQPHLTTILMLMWISNKCACDVQFAAVN